MGQRVLLPFWRKACWGFFRHEKSANLGSKGQHATSRPRMYVRMYFMYLNTFFWEEALGLTRFSEVSIAQKLKYPRLEYFHALIWHLYVETFCCIFAPQNVRFCFTCFGENSDLFRRFTDIKCPRTYVLREHCWLTVGWVSEWWRTWSYFERWCGNSSLKFQVSFRSVKTVT